MAKIIRLVVAFTLTPMLNRKWGRMIEDYEGKAGEALGILRSLKALVRVTEGRAVNGDPWDDIRRLLGHNQASAQTTWLVNERLCCGVTPWTAAYQPLTRICSTRLSGSAKHSTPRSVGLGFHRRPAKGWGDTDHCRSLVRSVVQCLPDFLAKPECHHVVHCCPQRRQSPGHGTVHRPSPEARPVRVEREGQTLPLMASQQQDSSRCKAYRVHGCLSGCGKAATKQGANLPRHCRQECAPSHRPGTRRCLRTSGPLGGRQGEPRATGEPPGECTQSGHAIRSRTARWTMA